MRKLVGYGLAATLLLGVTAPAAALSWTGCSNPLNVCMNFVLTEPTTNNFVLVTDFSAPDYPLATLNAFGLLDADDVPGPTVADAEIFDYTGWDGVSAKDWTIDNQGLGGGVWVTAGANPGDGLGTPGFVEIHFTSTYALAEFEPLVARAHVQRLTSTSCSMQWASNVEGYVESMGTDCAINGGGSGEGTVPEPITLILLGSGLLGLGTVRLHRRK